MRYSSILRLGATLLLLSCAGDARDTNIIPSNTTPVAQAGADQKVATGKKVTLDAGASSDADHDSLTYSWTFSSRPVGSHVKVSDAGAVNPVFTPDVDGAYVLSLVVNDGAVDSAADTVAIHAESANVAPVARAGADRNVDTDTLVTLDGSASSDADGDTLTYVWSFASRPTGSVAALSNTGAIRPAFTPDLDGTYVLHLVVHDGMIASAADAMAVVATNPGIFTPPAAHVAVNFVIDDSANMSYDATDGLAWKGSFVYNPATRIMAENASWTGPYAMLYDDGPWDSGGHEPAGALAGDHIWGITVWVSNVSNDTYEYGAIRGSVNGGDGTWIWIGANSFFSITAGSTTPIDATRLNIPRYGTVDLKLTVDVSGNGANLDVSFQGVTYTDVDVKGNRWNWDLIALVDNGTLGDLTASDGVYTFVLSEIVAKHTGLLFADTNAEIVILLNDYDYKAANYFATGVSAYTDSGTGWQGAALIPGASALTVTVPP